MQDLEALPGGRMALDGIEDLRQGRHTVPALWVSIAAGALRELGLPIGAAAAQPELQLYAALSDRPDPYSAYNALLRELVSFRRALEGERGRRLRGASRR